MANVNNRVKLWRGTRANYNALSSYDYWTEYFVAETNGTWKVYFGTKEVSVSTGELSPVKKVLTPEQFTALTTEEKSQGARYLVGSSNVYYVVEFGPTTSVEATKIDPLGNYSVRVEDRNFKRYQLAKPEGSVVTELITYDHDLVHDCGEY